MTADGCLPQRKEESHDWRSHTMERKRTRSFITETSTSTENARKNRVVPQRQAITGWGDTRISYLQWQRINQEVKLSTALSVTATVSLSSLSEGSQSVSTAGCVNTPNILDWTVHPQEVNYIFSCFWWCHLGQTWICKLPLGRAGHVLLLQHSVLRGTRTFSVFELTLDLEFEALDIGARFSDKIFHYLIKGSGLAQRGLTENAERKTNGSDFLAHRTVDLNVEGSDVRVRW